MDCINLYARGDSNVSGNTFDDFAEDTGSKAPVSDN